MPEKTVPTPPTYCSCRGPQRRANCRTDRANGLPCRTSGARQAVDLEERPDFIPCLCSPDCTDDYREAERRYDRQKEQDAELARYELDRDLGAMG
jgi:hypothetical protein